MADFDIYSDIVEDLNIPDIPSSASIQATEASIEQYTSTKYNEDDNSSDAMPALINVPKSVDYSQIRFEAPSNWNVYAKVEKLEWWITEDDIAALVSDLPGPPYVRIYDDYRNGSSAGTAQVMCPSPEVASLAAERLNGKMVKDVTIASHFNIPKRNHYDSQHQVHHPHHQEPDNDSVSVTPPGDGLLPGPPQISPQRDNSHHGQQYQIYSQNRSQYHQNDKNHRNYRQNDNVQTQRHYQHHNTRNQHGNYYSNNSYSRYNKSNYQSSRGKRFNREYTSDPPSQKQRSNPE